MAIRARPYETDEDLRRMQSLRQELWALEGPRVQTHVGDLAWWLHRPVWKPQLWLRDGARRAVVYAGGRDEDQGARALYESVGFRQHTRVVEFRKQGS